MIACKITYEHRRMKACFLMWYIFKEDKVSYKIYILVIKIIIPTVDLRVKLFMVTVK